MHFERSAVACRPVDWSATVYPGSMQSTCAECKVTVWVGPRQQHVVGLGAGVFCFECAARLFVENELGIISLRNPYKVGE
jgi:hypothetical protein